MAALADLLQGGDAGARRAALVLFESIAARAPAASAPVLGRVVLAERTPDDARVAALLDPAPYRAAVADAAPGAGEGDPAGVVAPPSRSAALPLYARLVSPAEAEEIARNEMKGPPAARASAAAVWGAVATTRPDEAAPPLKAMLYDPSMEVRVEAARAYGYLKREGLELVDKALNDPSPEVERAALESASALAAAYPVPGRRHPRPRAQDRAARGAPQPDRDAGAHGRGAARGGAAAAGARDQGQRRRDARRGGERVLRARQEERGVDGALPAHRRARRPRRRAHGGRRLPGRRRRRRREGGVAHRRRARGVADSRPCASAAADALGAVGAGGGAARDADAAQADRRRRSAGALERRARVRQGRRQAGRQALRRRGARAGGRAGPGRRRASGG